MEWPQSFYDLKRGEGCPMCAQGRPEETEYGRRASSPARSRTRTCRRRTCSAATPSSSGAAATWPSRPSWSSEEAAQYWLELLEAGAADRALTWQPVKLNYDILGNSLPHLHTHVMPRYADDPKPGWPFPHPEGDRGVQDDDQFRRDLEALRA